MISRRMAPQVLQRHPPESPHKPRLDNLITVRDVGSPPDRYLSPSSTAKSSDQSPLLLLDGSNYYAGHRVTSRSRRDSTMANVDRDLDPLWQDLDWYVLTAS
jgi:hypothetical protein